MDPPDGTGVSALTRRRPRSRGSRNRDGLASRVPVKPSSAGSSVSEPSTTIATVAAAATATPFISDSRSTSRPSMPITTVVPATSDGTARGAHRVHGGVFRGHPGVQRLHGTGSR